MLTALSYLLTFLLFCTSLFLILIVLVQRGKGGGLVGALGGMGGQSAFGAKAGGIFWATSIAAGVWILLCIISVKVNSAGNKVFAGASGANAASLTNEPNSVEATTDPAKPGATGAATTPAKDAPPTGTGTGAAPSTPPTGAADAPKGEVTNEKDFAEEAAPVAPVDKK